MPSKRLTNDTVKRVNIFIPSHLSERVKKLSEHQNMSQSAVMQLAVSLGMTVLENQLLNIQKKGVDQNETLLDVVKQLGPVFETMGKMTPQQRENFLNG